MHDLAYYSKDALLRRHLFTINSVESYDIDKAYGVTKLYYNIRSYMPAGLGTGTSSYDSGTHYFDTSSEKEISVSEYNNRKEKNKNAVRSAEKGEEFVRQKNYEKAFKEFNDAYNNCSNGYVNESHYKRRRENTRIKWADSLNEQGNDLHNNQRKYLEAIAKYQRAQELCTDDMNDRKKIYFVHEANSSRVLKKYEKSMNLFDAAYFNVASKTTFSSSKSFEDQEISAKIHNFTIQKFMKFVDFSKT